MASNSAETKIRSEKPPIARPAGCAARANEDLMVCEKCGLEWLVGELGPQCNPITFEVLRLRTLSEIASAEASLSYVRAIKRGGQPADPTAARRRLAEIEAVSRLVDRCMSDRRIKELLNGKE
jgi:hypothetical protein